MSKILKDLYDSEINFSIVTFWDAGFNVKLGDQINGFEAETTVYTFAEAVEWLRAAAVEAYPESVFAQTYGSVTSLHG
jgi:hypothetical protein